MVESTEKDIVVRMLFLGLPKGFPKWPNKDFDPEVRIRMIKEFLLKSFPDIKFIGWNWIKDEKGVDNIMENWVQRMRVLLSHSICQVAVV